LKFLGTNRSSNLALHQDLRFHGPCLSSKRVCPTLIAGKTTCQRGFYCPPDRLRSVGQSRPNCATSDTAKRDARLKHLLTGVHRRETMEHFLELIKEDHFGARASSHTCVRHEDAESTDSGRSRNRRII